MKPSAIVYTSNTGFTAQYASLLGGETGLPVYSLEDASKSLPRSSPIIYLGWLTAGKVQGYDKAVTKFNLQAPYPLGTENIYRLPTAIWISKIPPRFRLLKNTLMTA